jgi:chemotaxis signal transduction protein
MSEIVVVDVGDRRVCIPSSQARELAAVGWITPVPTAPPTVAGVMQLRGQILPILDIGVGVRRPVQPEDSVLVVEYGPTRAALRILELLPVDTPAERLDLGALFDSLRTDALRGSGGEP